MTTTTPLNSSCTHIAWSGVAAKTLDCDLLLFVPHSRPVYLQDKAAPVVLL